MSDCCCYFAWEFTAPPAPDVSGDIYVFGGGGLANELYEYNTSLDSWAAKTNGTSTPYTRTFSLDADKGYSAGGDAIFSATDVTREYSKSSDAWANLQVMASARGWGSAFALSSKGYYAYGFNGTAPAKETQEYVPSSDTWSFKTDGPSPIREALCGGAAGGKGYSLTGRDTSTTTQFFGDVEEYDQSGDSWASKTDVSPVRHSSACSVVSDKIYIYYGWRFGGSFGTTRMTNTDEYDPSGDSWASKTAAPLPVRATPVGNSSGGTAYSFGGENGSTIADTEGYDVAGDSWTSLTNMPSAKGAPGSFTIPA